jgi:Cys-rich protein (TIGR01571 family)
MCHPHLCNAWLCPQVLLGQVLVRMKMTWLVHRLHPNADDHHDAHDRCGGGKRHTTKVSTSSSSSSSSVQSAFRKIMVLVVLLTVYDSLVAPPLFEVQVDEDTGEVSLASRFSSGGDFPGWHQVLYLLLSLPMTVWGIIVVVRLRASVRQRYNIPTGRLGKWEDLVCVCCCNCCVMSQMARQTADYDGDEPASCCSPSGTRTSNKKDDAMDEVVDCEMNDDATTSTQSLSVPSSPSSLTSSSAIASDSCHVNSSGSARSRRPDGRINQSRQEISRPCTMATVV